MNYLIPTEHFTLGFPSVVFSRARTLDRIKRLVCDYYDLKPGDMASPRRDDRIAHPRQAAMFLARDELGWTLPKIGRAFGNRDHTTVIHAVKAVQKRMAADPDYEAEVEYLRRRLVG